MVLSETGIAVKSCATLALLKPRSDELYTAGRFDCNVWLGPSMNASVF